MSTVFVHSRLRDFAKTQQLAESDYLGRFRQAGALRLCGCGCGTGRLSRMRRELWMRLFPLLRLYCCLCCGARVLRLRMRQRASAYGPVYQRPRART